MAQEINLNKKQTIALIDLLEDVQYHIEHKIPEFSENFKKRVDEKILYFKNRLK